ncbi:hypothetical protein [Vibrio phage S4-7]|nr:hypothetical protein [Vibrio phage S4-7]
MNKLLLTLGLLFTGYAQSEVILEKQVYKYECSYSTSWKENGEMIFINIRGEVSDLSELKGKQEITVDSDGVVTKLEVGNCRVEV